MLPLIQTPDDVELQDGDTHRLGIVVIISTLSHVIDRLSDCRSKHERDGERGELEPDREELKRA